MTLSAEVKSSGRDRLARLLSNAFHPFLISLVTLVLVIYLDGATLFEAFRWAALSLGIVIIPLTLYLVINVRRGHYSTWSIELREQRHGIYIVAGVCFSLLILVFIFTGAPAIALACLVAAMATVATAAAINRLMTKVSLHSVAMAGCTTALFWVSPLLGLLLAVAALAVGWARIWLRQHTLTQIVLGWVLAAGSVIIVFSLSL